MKKGELRDKKILIVGLGVEGKATLDYLKRNLPKNTIETTDLKDGPNYLNKQEEFDLAVRSPGVKKELITIPYTTATNIFFANVKKPVIGVTGSKGKSTTASVIHHLLQTAGRKSQLAGNIGQPLLSVIEMSVDYFVVELSSFQLEDINYSPHISVLTSVFPEHMDHHGDFQNYLQAKKRILQFSTANDYYVYNTRYEDLVSLSRETKAQPIPFEEALPPGIEKIPLIGQHNLENLLGAVTVCHLLKIEDKFIKEGIETFKPLPHRLEKVGTFKGVTFYDDAISTTPQSAIAALDSLENVSTILLGGEDRGYDFGPLVAKLKEKRVANVVLFPDSGLKIKSLLPAGQFKILETKDMEEAVKFGYANSPEGSVCLLSSGSPSYSLWKNFEEKGDLFQEMVKKLAK